jgi:hypothetical protein
VLDGPRAGRPTNLVVSNADEARRAVQESKRGGADFIKVYDFLSRESLLAIAAEAKAQGLAFVGHVPLVVPAGDASDAGQRSLEHLSGVLWSASSKEDEIRTRAETFSPRSPAALRPVDIKTLVDTFSLDKLRRLAARLKTNQTAVVPTLSLERNRFEGRRLDSMLQATNRLQYVPPAYVELWRGQSHPLTEEEERLQFQQYLVSRSLRAPMSALHFRFPASACTMSSGSWFRQA